MNTETIEAKKHRLTAEYRDLLDRVGADKSLAKQIVDIEIELAEIERETRSRRAA